MFMKKMEKTRFLKNIVNKNVDQQCLEPVANEKTVILLSVLELF